MDHGGNHDDVSATLSDLERKLKALELELELVGDGGAPAPAQPAFHATIPPTPRPQSPSAAVVSPPAQEAPVDEWRTYATAQASPAMPAMPAASSAGARAQASRRFDELLRVREQLVHTADRLVAELQRVLDDLQTTTPALLQSGDVTVDAEPFANLASLSAFEQALSQVPGVSQVYVRSLDSGRARLEAALERPVDLAAELRRTTPVHFQVIEVAEATLALRLVS